MSAPKTPIASRYSPRRPCPVCGSGSKSCSVTGDGLQICRGVDGPPPAGWVVIPPDPDKMGFRHFRRDDPKRPAARKPAGRPPTWGERADAFAAALTPELRDELADLLGLPAESLAALPGIGFHTADPLGPCWTFPEVDAAGQVVGVNRRWRGRVSIGGGKPTNKAIMGGGGRGLTVPAAWPGDGPVLTVEGASDVLAADACGVAAVGRPNNAAGADLLAGLLAGVDPARRVYVLGENDQRPDTRPGRQGQTLWPGKEGTDAVAPRLAAKLGRPVYVAYPPEGVKDLRAWVIECTAGAAGRVDWPAIGLGVLAELERTAVRVDPPASLTDPAPAPPAPPPPRGLATTRLDAIDPTPVRWLVPGYIPLGKLVLFAGDGGHGKTTLTLHMAACLTTGRPCFGLDYPAPAPAEVLIASCEDDFADTVVPRLVTTGGDRSKVHRLDGVPGAEPGKPHPFSLAHCDRLAEFLADNPRVKLVVIDPAGAYIGGAGVDDHKDSELRTLLGPLAELAARHGVTVLLVKHLNKGATSKAVHRVGGSAGYVNAVRASFVICPDQSEPDKKLFLPLKFNIAAKPPGLVYRLKPPAPADREAVLDLFPSVAGDDREQLGSQLFLPVWDGQAGVDADSALGEHVKSAPTRVEECREWLAGFLGEYAWPDDEVEQAAEESGFPVPLLRKAKTAMRKDGEMRSKNSGTGTPWWNWLGDARKPDRPTPPRGLTDLTDLTDPRDSDEPDADQSGPRLFHGGSSLPD